MNRMALALALATLGTGCIVTDDEPAYGDLNLYWEFYRTKADAFTVLYDPVDSAPAGTGACVESDVDYVAILHPAIPGGGITWDCRYGGVQGVTLLDMPAGTYDLRVVGYRVDLDYASDIALYDSDVTVAVYGGSVSQATAEVYGRWADLTLYADLRNAIDTASFASCLAAGVTEIDYFLVDVASTVVASGTVPCSDPTPPGVAFTGAAALDLDEYRVRFKAYASSVDTVPDFDTNTPFFGCGVSRVDHYEIDPVWTVNAYDVLGYLPAELCP